MNPPVDIAEQLAAFLAGELDDDAAERVQRRIDSEPWVARLADQTAEVMMDLAGVDEVEPAAGYEERLRDAVAAEVGRPVEDLTPDARSLTAATAAATGWATKPPARRQDRRPRRRAVSSGRFLAVAAGFTLVAVAAVGALVSSDFGSGAADSVDTAAATSESAAGEAEGRSLADDSAPAEEAVEDQGGAQEAMAEFLDDQAAADQAGAAGTAEAETEAATAEAPAAVDEDDSSDDAEILTAQPPLAASSGPRILTLGSVEAGDAELRALIAEDPAAQALLGAPAGQITETAAAYRDEILRGGAYADGTVAEQCLAEVLQQAGSDLVPAVAARVDLPERGPSIAFALVRSAGGEVLDNVDVYVVGAGDCQLQQVLGG